ncbi:MspA family porin [Mycobacterium sp. RTGN5]|uniref:MspA family porin n=1 Tax=Mycobacterium sp. RTGN5 TaxID=3016522 RepID=UPI0029C9469E|nr:MspA family porin [Mycobacterium sp. RTGN5]
MFVRRAVLMALVGTLLATPVPAWADPDPGGPDLAQPVAAADPALPPPVDDGKVMSTPPISTKSPDGWTLTISAKDELQMPIAPLTTAISSREYTVSGVFNGALDGPSDMPKGVFEVGYQIGCGIDMSTSNGVALGGTMGLNASLGFIGLDFPNNAADGLLPGIGGNVGGAITVGLKPGIINMVPVTKKEYKGDRPWVSISNFHVKIDGCVGESFIRSYATLSKSTDEGDAILSWYGVTKKI